MLTPPLSTQTVLAGIWRPALLMLPAKLRGSAGDVMGLAIGGQETGYLTRVQYGNGPAHSFWQMEQGGGVKGVMTHPASMDMALIVCQQLGVAFTPAAVWEAMTTNDDLGAAFARLLLWTSPHSLPTIGDEDASWEYYVGLWRPGKPDRARWKTAYASAVAAVRGT